MKKLHLYRSKRGAAAIIWVVAIVAFFWLALSIRQWRDERRWDKGVSVLAEKAKTGDASSMYALGEAYEQKGRTFENYTTAEEWYERASDQGHQIAEERARYIRGELHWLRASRFVDSLIGVVGWFLGGIVVLIVGFKILMAVSLSRSLRRVSKGEGNALDAARIAKHVISTLK